MYRDYLEGTLRPLFMLTGLTKPVSRGKRFLNYMCKLACCLHVLVCPLQLLVRAVQLSDDIITSTEALVVGITNINVMGKLYYMYLREKRLKDAILCLKDLISCQRESPVYIKSLDSAERSIRRIRNGFLIIFGVCVMAAIIMALATTYFGSSADDGGNSPKKPPLEMYFPFDGDDPFNYAFIVVYESVLSFMGIVIYTTTYTTFCALIIHTCCQIEVLTYKLAEIGDTMIMRGENMVQSHIKEIVRHHVAIIRIVDDINNLFGEALFMEIILSSLQTCLVLFQCSKRSITDPEVGFFFPFLFCTTIMPFSICWGGEKLKNNSSKLRDAVYQMPWYKLSPPLRKDVSFMLLQTRRTLTLNARNTFFMDMETFGKTIQTAYSYFTMLRSVTN